MPTNTGAQEFVQEIRLELESAQAITDMSSAIQTATGRLNAMGTQIENAQAELQEIGVTTANAFDFDLNDLDKAQDELVRLTNLVQDMDDMKGMDLDYASAVSQIGQIRSALVGAENAQEQLTTQVQRYGQEGAEAGQRVERSMRRTSQTSQNLLRIIQDAPFGILGVANNIQALAEDLGRASTQGRGMINQLKTGVKNLITGPFAIPAIITAVTVLWQSWDKVVNGINQLKGVLGIITELEAEVSSANESIEEQINKYSELKAVVKGLAGLEGEELVDAQKTLALQLTDTTTALSDAEQKLEDVQARQSELAKAGEGNSEAFRDLGRESGVLQQKISDLGPEQTALQQALRATAAGSLQELRLRNKLIDAYGLSEAQARKLAKAITEKTEAQRAENQAINANLKLRELQNEARQEGLERTLEEIDIAAERRRNQLEDKFAGSDLLDQILGAADDLEAKEKGRARLDAMLEAIEGAQIDVDPMDSLLGTSDAEAAQQQRIDAAKRNAKMVRDQVQTEMMRSSEAEAQADSTFFGLIPTESQLLVTMRQRMQQVRAEAGGSIRQMRAQVGDLQARLLATDPSSPEAAQLISQIAEIESRIVKKQRGATEERKDIEKEFQKERAQLVKQGSMEALGNAESAATMMFDTWRTQRQRDLENQGKTQEQQRKILMEEGKKRFQVMKAIRIANAVAAGIEATQSAFATGQATGVPGLGVAFAAAAAAKAAARVNQLRQLSIGDSMPGSSGGGSGTPGGQFTQLNADAAARRAGNAGTNLANGGTNTTQNSQETDRMSQAASRLESAAKSIENQRVTIDDKTAERANDVAVRRKRKFNG